MMYFGPSSLSFTSDNIDLGGDCLVPVRRFPSLSQLIRFGDISEANGWDTPRQKQNARA